MATRKRPRAQKRTLDDITSEIAQTKQKLCDLEDEKYANVEYMRPLFPDVIIDKYIDTNRLTYYKTEHNPCHECDDHGITTESLFVVVGLDGKMHEFRAFGCNGEWDPDDKCYPAFSCEDPHHDEDLPLSPDEAVNWKYLLELNHGDEARTFATLAVLSRKMEMTPAKYFANLIADFRLDEAWKQIHADARECVARITASIDKTAPPDTADLSPELIRAAFDLDVACDQGNQIGMDAGVSVFSKCSPETAYEALVRNSTVASQLDPLRDLVEERRRARILRTIPK